MFVVVVAVAVNGEKFFASIHTMLVQICYVD